MYRPNDTAYERAYAYNNAPRTYGNSMNAQGPPETFGDTGRGYS